MLHLDGLDISASQWLLQPSGLERLQVAENKLAAWKDTWMADEGKRIKVRSLEFSALPFRKLRDLKIDFADQQLGKNKGVLH